MQHNNKTLKIGIFASSSSLFGTRTPSTYKFLESRNIEVYEHPQVRVTTGHTAGTIKDRVNGLHDLFLDKTIDIVMAFWGGQNTNEILPYLDYALIKSNPKLLIGYSDTTALLLAVSKLTGLITYMGPAGITFTKPEPVEYSWNYFQKILINRAPTEIRDSDVYADDYYFLNPDASKRTVKRNEGRKVFNHGVTNGESIAANLQTLLVLSSTKYFPDLKGKVLFIEEAEEESVGMIHRYFTQLTQIMDTNELKGICIGRFCEQSKFSDTDSVEDLLSTVFPNIKIPVVYNLDFGHSDPMLTIPNGGYCSLDTKKNTLILSNNIIAS